LQPGPAGGRGRPDRSWLTFTGSASGAVMTGTYTGSTGGVLLSRAISVLFALVVRK
jgi:hypothetical protein